MMDTIINLKSNNIMNTIEVKHRVPTTVYTTAVKLPLFFKTGRYVTHYMCMQADGNLIDISSHGGYWDISVVPHDEPDDISHRLEKEFSEMNYEQIDEAVFHHKFSEAHREIFYMVNPNLRARL
jgi:hypothetical protein